jgi:hypothetical protein
MHYQLLMKSGYQAPMESDDPLKGEEDGCSSSKWRVVDDIMWGADGAEEARSSHIRLEGELQHISLAPETAKHWNHTVRKQSKSSRSLPSCSTSAPPYPVTNESDYDDDSHQQHVDDLVLGQLWQWCNQDAPTLPQSHPLDPTSIFVPNTTSRMVASRIRETLRNLSIEAIYAPPDESELVRLHQANCRTIDGVDFRVFLYRGRGASYSHGTIVEIVRWHGSSFDFHLATRSIFAAAKDQPVKPYQRKRRQTYPIISTNASLEDDEETKVYKCQSSLRFISNLLAGTNPELALQMLVSMTDLSHDGKQSAIMYCELVTQNTSTMLSIVRLISAYSLLTLRLLVHLSPYLDWCLERLVRPVLMTFLKDAAVYEQGRPQHEQQQWQQQAYLAVQCIVEPRQEDYPILLQVAKMAEDQHLGLYEEALERLLKLV